ERQCPQRPTSRWSSSDRLAAIRRSTIDGHIERCVVFQFIIHFTLASNSVELFIKPPPHSTARLRRSRSQEEECSGAKRNEINQTKSMCGIRKKICLDGASQFGC